MVVEDQIWVYFALSVLLLRYVSAPGGFCDTFDELRDRLVYRDQTIYDIHFLSSVRKLCLGWSR